MSVFIFLWCAWALVILLYFFLYRKVPLIYCCHVLIIIFLSQFFIPYDGQEINVACLYIVFLACFYIGKLPLKRMVYAVLTSIIIALGNGCYYIFASLEPLWFSWVPAWVPIALILYAVMVLQKEYAGRQLTLVMGICFGDALLSFAYHKSWLHYPLFSESLLNSLAPSTLFLIAWTLTESALRNMATYQHSHKKEI